MMKAIQSIWTKPIYYQNAIKESRFYGGWLDLTSYLASVAFSALQIKKYYNELDLITDTFGKKIFIEILQIPYDNVKVTLDCLEGFDECLWSLGKIYACAMQDEPFIHFDTDLFIWAKIKLISEDNILIAQNMEYDCPIYPPLIKEVIDNFKYVPDFILELANYGKEAFVYNTGIIGGSNLALIKKFAKEAIWFVFENYQRLTLEKNGELNVIFEQLFFTKLATDHQQTVICHSDLKDLHELNHELKGYDLFLNAPESTKYIHLYGRDCKQDPRYCEEILRKLCKEYPESYKRIIEFDTQKIDSLRSGCC
jgi:hypothetical protein